MACPIGSESCQYLGSGGARSATICLVADQCYLTHFGRHRIFKCWLSASDDYKMERVSYSLVNLQTVSIYFSLTLSILFPVDTRASLSETAIEELNETLRYEQSRADQTTGSPLLKLTQAVLAIQKTAETLRRTNSFDSRSDEYDRFLERAFRVIERNNQSRFVSGKEWYELGYEGEEKLDAALAEEVSKMNEEAQMVGSRLLPCVNLPVETKFPGIRSIIDRFLPPIFKSKSLENALTAEGKLTSEALQILLIQNELFTDKQRLNIRNVPVSGQNQTGFFTVAVSAPWWRPWEKSKPVLVAKMLDDCTNEGRSLRYLNPYKTLNKNNVNILISDGNGNFVNQQYDLPKIAQMEKVIRYHDQINQEHCFLLLHAAQGASVNSFYPTIEDIEKAQSTSAPGEQQATYRNQIVEHFRAIGRGMGAFHYHFANDRKATLENLKTQIHCDLHGENLFYDPDKKRLTFIDNRTFRYDDANIDLKKFYGAAASNLVRGLELFSYQLQYSKTDRNLKFFDSKKRAFQTQLCFLTTLLDAYSEPFQRVNPGLRADLFKKYYKMTTQGCEKEITKLGLDPSDYCVARCN